MKTSRPRRVGACLRPFGGEECRPSELRLSFTLSRAPAFGLHVLPQVTGETEETVAANLSAVTSLCNNGTFWSNRGFVVLQILTSMPIFYDRTHYSCIPRVLHVCICVYGHLELGVSLVP